MRVGRGRIAALCFAKSWSDIHSSRQRWRYDTPTLVDLCAQTVYDTFQPPQPCQQFRIGWFSRLARCSTRSREHTVDSCSYTVCTRVFFVTSHLSPTACYAAARIQAGCVCGSMMTIVLGCSWFRSVG